MKIGDGGLVREPLNDQIIQIGGITPSCRVSWLMPRSFSTRKSRKEREPGEPPCSSPKFSNMIALMREDDDDDDDDDDETDAMRIRIVHVWCRHPFVRESPTIWRCSRFSFSHSGHVQP